MIAAAALFCGAVAPAQEKAPEKDKPAADAAKKEPPKPRHVVDVYRGEKHVQETFQ